MVYLTQYLTRKGILMSKTLEAPSVTDVKDYIRHQGARDIVIISRGQGFFCKKCGKLVEGDPNSSLCKSCAESGGRP